MKLLQVFFKAVHIHGERKLTKIIESTFETNNPNQKLLQEYIIKVACDIYKVDRDELFKGKSTSAKTKVIVACSYALSYHLKLSQVEIGNLLKKDNTIISKHLKKINNLDRTHAEDEKILTDLAFIDIKVEEFKLKLEENGRSTEEKG